MSKAYETVIGLEVHVELATRTKIFCSCSTQFGGAANTHTCPVCTGMPGSLPVLNRQVVEYALAAGLALHCEVNRYCRFDRKNYFYPDNPQNYQISQLYLPICHDGYLEIEMDTGKPETQNGGKRIRIHEIHMEEDAGKLIHDEWTDCSQVDFNRSGVPLIEIVSEPDMGSGEEVIAYLDKLRLILQYLGVSDCKQQEGSMRADVNLSVREIGAPCLGTRTEMKNLNSFKAIKRAIEGERARQIECLTDGKAVIQETRRWDDNKEMSYPMRSKEDSRDYRYFPDPDLPPVTISEEWIARLKAHQPELHTEKMARYERQYRLSAYDAELLTASKHLSELFEASVAICQNPKETANWLLVEGMRLMKKYAMEMEEITFSPENLAKLVDMVDNSIVNRTAAKEIFEKIYLENVNPEAYAKEHELGVVKDEEAMRTVIQQIVKDYPKSVKDFLGGKDKAFGFLVGQVMRVMKDKADPMQVNKLLEELLKSEGKSPSLCSGEME